jgi:hypothetical protein
VDQLSNLVVPSLEDISINSSMRSASLFRLGELLVAWRSNLKRISLHRVDDRTLSRRRTDAILSILSSSPNVQSVLIDDGSLLSLPNFIMHSILPKLQHLNLKLYLESETDTEAGCESCKTWSLPAELLDVLTSRGYRSAVPINPVTERIFQELDRVFPNSRVQRNPSMRDGPVRLQTLSLQTDLDPSLLEESQRRRLSALQDIGLFVNFAYVPEQRQDS